MGLLVMLPTAWGGLLAEVPDLRPDETLKFGEWLVSENGQFRMGFDRGGDLVVEAIGPVPPGGFPPIRFSPRAARPGWSFHPKAPSGPMRKGGPPRCKDGLIDGGGTTVVVEDRMPPPLPRIEVPQDAIDALARPVPAQGPTPGPTRRGKAKAGGRKGHP